MPQTAPRVLTRFKNSENRIAGRSAEAAIANATATRNATLRPRAKMPRTTATAPITRAAYRATVTSSRSLVRPLRTTLAYRSCATLDDEARVSPGPPARNRAEADAPVQPRGAAPAVGPARDPRA